jgi:hypothetical protein
MRQPVKKIWKMFTSRTPDKSQYFKGQILSKALITHFGHEITGQWEGIVQIVAMLQLAAQNGSEGSLSAIARDLKAECQSFGVSVYNFIEYVKYGADMREARHEAIDIRHLLETIITNNRHAAAEKGITIVLAVSDEVPDAIISDEIRITGICTNILLDMIRNARQGTHAYIRVQKQNDDWLLLFQNINEGKERSSNIFELSSDKDENTPLNLNLFLASYLTRDVLQGNISVSYAQDQERTFSILLPIPQLHF